MGDHEPAKKLQKCDDSGSLDPNKRKQVDAHVQAFLKAILNHAHGNARVKSVAKAGPKKETRDAETQTQDVDVVNDQSYFMECSFPQSESSTGGSCVPNREMYSEETLTFASQYGSYYDQVNQAFSSGGSGQSHYYSSDAQAVLHSGQWNTQKPSKLSSDEMRRVISNWAESYQQWFYQNFGLDLHTVERTVPVTSDAKSVQPPVTVPSLPTVAPGVLSNNTSATVLSRPPVSYIVAEGSICVPDSQLFTPYVSLLPSFYAPVAFNNGLTASVPFGSFAASQYPLCTVPQLSQPNVLTHGVTTLPTIYSPSSQLAQHILGSVSSSSLQSTSTVVNGVTNSSMQTNRLDGATVAPLSSSFVDLPKEMQTSAVFAAFAVPIANGRQPTLGQWGPLLRYGTYGRLPSDPELKYLTAQKASYGSSDTTAAASVDQKDASSATSSDLDRVAKKMPPPPPTCILLRRQAMICALQIFCRERGRELFYKEKEGISGMKIDYATELDNVVEKSINIRPVYLFTRLSKLPSSAKPYFLGEESSTFSSIQDSTQQLSWSEQTRMRHSHFPPSQVYACDILIGDVLIACACSTFKSQARMCAAKRAFQILSQPCFLVGSIRRWEGVEYLVLCLSPKADLVPQLPPFLSDPFESLTKKDRTVDLNNPEENFEVVNPKPFDDIWLYLANLPIDSFDDESFVDQILAQSAEFSQMTIEFEVELDTENGSFVCSALVDNQRGATFCARDVSEAQSGAAKALLKFLQFTQPIVGLQSDLNVPVACQQNVDPLWGVPEHILVDTLMWGKEEREEAIDIEQLYAQCEVPPYQSPPPNSPICEDTESGDPGLLRGTATANSSQYFSIRKLDNALQTYAASALVTPLRVPSAVVAPGSWSTVHQFARNWGLLSENDHRVSFNHSIFVCKRVPLPRLKRTLFEKCTYGCLRLVSQGSLSADALKRLFSSDPLVYEQPTDSPNDCSLSSPTCGNENRPCESQLAEEDPYADEFVTRLARHFRSTAPSSNQLKSEPTPDDVPPVLEDCVLIAAELNQPSSAIEILDDLPRTLIPGIDF